MRSQQSASAPPDRWEAGSAHAHATPHEIPRVCCTRPAVWCGSSNSLCLVRMLWTMSSFLQVRQLLVRYGTRLAVGNHCGRCMPSIGLNFQQMPTRVVEVDGLPLPPCPGCQPWAAPIVHGERSIAIGYPRRLHTAKCRVELVGVHRKGIVPT